jgi:hypothetical protein
MKRLLPVFVALLAFGLLLLSISDASAAIRLKNIGIAKNYTTAAWRISNGLKVVGVNTKAFMKVDTAASGATGTPSWTLVSKPAGSVAQLDSTGTMINSITVDQVGSYYIQATVGGQSATDTIYASTYMGVPPSASAACGCHNSGYYPPASYQSKALDMDGIKASWQTTGHAKIFTEGMTGKLEQITEIKTGLYKPSCIQCHAVGFQPEANNGNYAYLAKSTGFDTSWYNGLKLSAGGDYLVPESDTIYNKMSADTKLLGYIGCESCHGPLYGHRTDWYTGPYGKADASLNSDVCNQCHNASGKHSLGKGYDQSRHKTGTTWLSEGGNKSCYPCHTGAGFVFWSSTATHDTTGLSARFPSYGDSPVSCAVCHDPHGKNDATNPWNLRVTKIDSLKSQFKASYIPPANRGGYGNLCASACHQGRYSTYTRVLPNKPPYYGFVNRYGVHYGPQADMLYGTNGYQYEDPKMTGISTHLGLENTCVTCHMADRNGLPNHQMSMDEAKYAGMTPAWDPLESCKSCHGAITSYSDIKASYDYDGNGKIEGAQTEVQGLLDSIKAHVPLDTTPTSDHYLQPVYYTYDSLKIKNHPEYVKAIWNYYFVESDGSMGVHNTQYAVALLRRSLLDLGAYPTGVKVVDGQIPGEFKLTQNYPNPFNPTTNISFSLPKSEHVRIDIYNIVGELVRTLVDQEFAPGTFQVVWDGRDSHSSQVASGVYLYRMQAGSFTNAKKMLMTK